MDWYTEAKARRELDPSFGYGKIAKEYGLSYDVVRNKFRRDPSNKEEKVAEKTEESLDKRLYKLLNSGKQFDKEYLCNKFNIPQKILSATLECLKDDGIQIWDTNYTVELVKVVIPSDNYHQEDWNGERIVKFGVVTDVHTGSKFQQYGHLHKFYNLCEREGVPFVYNCGDIIDGVNMRPGHQFECTLVGVDAQVDYVIKNYPSNLPTKFIIGNHCTSAIKSAGVDIGRIIASQRKDMEYLGALNARVEITPNCIVELSHPLSGSSYAISYKSQRGADAIMGGTKPNILLIGHYHKMEYLFYRNIHIIQAGCFQAQTDWMRGKEIAAMMGGVIVTMHVDKNGNIIRFQPEFIPEYKYVPDKF